jgi:hypothetical protein
VKKPFLFLIPLLCFSLVSSGCTAQQVANGANTADHVISGVLTIAQAEEPALPPADAAMLASWVNQGQTLEGQLHSCISGATAAGSKSAAIASCFNTFASGFLNPTELAGFHITSAATQAKVQTYITIAIIAVNGVLSFVKSAPVSTPTIAPASAAEISSTVDELAANDPIIERYCQTYGCRPVAAAAGF